MSQIHPTADSSSSPSSSNFQVIMDNALDVYKKRTKNDLRSHPLAVQLQDCDSPSAILAVLQEQAQGLDQSRSADERWTKWLDPTVKVLHAFSFMIGTGAGPVFSSANVILAGVGILLSAAGDVRASQDTLVDIFERIEMFFRRLEIYTEVRATAEMMDVIIKIMVEVLSILGIATKEIKQSLMKRIVKKLIGKNGIEGALKRLDKLTHEEAWMGIAQNLKVAQTVGESVKAVDNRVAEVIRDGREVKVATQQTATDVDQMKRNQLRESIHKWLSPPDPSTNHNIACATQYKKTASWFFQGSMFQEWKSTGSLFWIHGKPGSGKSVLCSTVIQDIEAICEAGNASMAYFYFDFRDAKKQGLRDLVLSFITQLFARSGPRFDILSDLYSANDEGKNQPSDSALAECLKAMLTLPDRCPTYLIIDALDESPSTTGVLSPRERVLQLLEELVELRLPNLRICITSRPEIDIRDILEPLTSRRVSLHDQSGQKKDIEDYVKSVVYSNSQPIMRRWKTEDKELVIKVLSERADGMFRWIFCQLEVLRQCLPPSVRRTLDELPESLDETYERVLNEIKKPNRDHACRVLQCLVVAIRPLRVEELAEVLAVNFDDEEGMPKLNPNWRWDDQEQALMSSCSSLIAIVKSHGSRIVQFSHFSVKEYLTSARLGSSSGDILRYHIDLEPGHTILAQACLSVLLQSNDRVDESDVGNSSPLAGYAAEHWVTHAQVGKVSPCLRKAMEYLFDPDKPYFVAWLKLHDIDTDAPAGTIFAWFTPTSRPHTGVIPLYYAALCGFQDMVEHLVVKDPKQVNARGGWYLTPLVAALAGKHFQIAQLLHDHGADPNVRSSMGETPLHAAAFNGEPNMVQVLLKHKVDVNARDDEGYTPLHFPFHYGYYRGHNFDPSLSKVARLLLEHGADVNALKDDHSTPLHLPARYGMVEVVRVLLEHVANLSAEDSGLKTSSQVVVLSEYVNARNTKDESPLHFASEGPDPDFDDAPPSLPKVTQLLLEHGANVNALKDDHSTPLHMAARYGRVEVVRVLLEHVANLGAEYDERKPASQVVALSDYVNVRNAEGKTPLHLASEGHYRVYRGNDGVSLSLSNVARLLLERGADVNALSNDRSTPLHVAVLYERMEVVCALLEHAADVGMENGDGKTALQVASDCGYDAIVKLMLEHRAG